MIGMEIPYTALSDDALTNIITDFVSHTDDGAFDVPLSVKISRVKQCLAQGKCVITFDEETNSCFIIER